MLTSASRERAMVRWAVFGAAILLIVAVAVSPLALDSFGGGRDVDWQRRSVIGQTYGAISALVAALALGAIAVSVFFQWQEVRANREFARRAIHIDLMKMAIDDAELRECFSVGGRPETPSRQHLYCNLIFSFWESDYILGVLRPEEIRGLFAEMLRSQPGREFWLKAREYRLTHINSRQEQRFRHAFDLEYHRWLPSGSKESAQPPHAPGAI
jgi:uncharacterized membrane protein